MAAPSDDERIRNEELDRAIAERLADVHARRAWPWMEPGTVSVGLESGGLRQYRADDHRELVPASNPDPGLSLPDTVTDVADGVHGAASATFSTCRQYRYTLTRRWAAGPQVAYVLLNPSTADAFQLDPTLTRCRNLAIRDGYGAMIVTNVFAFRATDPKVMKAQDDPVGPANDAAILHAARTSEKIIAGWGVHAGHRGREQQVLALLAGMPLFRFGPTTKNGHPGHPLYLPNAVQVVPHP